MCSKTQTVFLKGVKNLRFFNAGPPGEFIIKPAVCGRNFSTTGAMRPFTYTRYRYS